MWSLYDKAKIKRLLWFGALVLSFPGIILCYETNNYKTEWHQLQLTVSADKMPLTKILTDITAQTGLEVRGSLTSQDIVSLAFTNLSLREGLQRLLAGKNYLIVDRKFPDGVVMPSLVLILDSQMDSIPLVAKEKMRIEADSDKDDVPARLSHLAQSIKANAPDLRETLYAAIRDNEPMIRELAYRELHQRGDAMVLDILRRDARSEDVDIRRTALETLPQLDPENAIEILSESLSDDSIYIRQNALEKLSKMEHGLVIIKSKLQDPDPDVRMAAIEVLASLGEDSAWEVTEETLHDADERVRAKAEAIRQDLQAMQASQQGNLRSD